MLHTADYFVIRTSGAGWVECKTDEDLNRLSERNPNRYRLDDRWRCPPGEANATGLGLSYLVRSSSDINWTFQANIQFLEDYFRDDRAVPAAIADRVIAGSACQPGITLAELREGTTGHCSHDEVYSLIAGDRLYVDLNLARLSQPEKVKVFPTAAAAALHQLSPTQLPARVDSGRAGLDAGSALNRDGKVWRIANLGAVIVTLIDDRNSGLQVRE